MHDSSNLTPLMQQYFEIKSNNPDAILLFQVGDFYELFFDDAKQAAAILGIALTKRGKMHGEDIPLCGIPVHVLDHYVAKLVRHGLKVALCDQLEQASPGKVVRRGVTAVMTPGTLTDSTLLDASSASYLFSFFPMEDSCGLLFGELLTAQLFACVMPTASSRMLESELVRFFPDEVLVPATAHGRSFQPYFRQLGYFVSEVDLQAASYASVAYAHDEWLAQFKPDTRTAITRAPALVRAMSLFFTYVRKTNEQAVANFTQLKLYSPDDFLLLDAATQRNLELVRNNQDGSRKNSLLSIMDGAATPMGSRMIKKWLVRPLVDQSAIEQRHDVVAAYTRDAGFMQHVRTGLKSVGDIERVIGRIALGKAQLHDYLMLKAALAAVPLLRQQLQTKMHEAALFEPLKESLQDFSALAQLLDAALYDEGEHAWSIKAGFDAALDRMRDVIASSQGKIVAFERAQQEATGISSLKVRFNQVQGYYIEITKANRDAVPSTYIYRQMLAGRERFTTPALQSLEYDIQQARSDIEHHEKKIFETVKHRVKEYTGSLRKLSHALANVDALLGFACVAYEYGYVRPTFNTSRAIIIHGGRHPVVATMTAREFVANDTRLTDAESLHIITGPNMGGKSTYLRQVALITLMNQCGSFVPAKAASLPIVDRIFTRIGAGDNVAEGKSTFLVEMEETAAICSYATKHSLVILDEVGRGTSTFDGLAIAQAVVEYVCQTVQARCLFATHYHELTRLSQRLPGIASYYAASKRTDRGILFLYTILRGVADGSFGIDVAQLATLPAGVIERAREIIEELDNTPGMASGHVVPARVSECVFHAQEVAELHKRIAEYEALIGILQGIDYENLSPKRAFDLLWQLRGQESR